MTLELLGIIFGSAVAGIGCYESVRKIFWRDDDDEEEAASASEQAPSVILGDCGPCKGWGWYHSTTPALCPNSKCLRCNGTGYTPKPGYLADSPSAKP